MLFDLYAGETLSAFLQRGKIKLIETWENSTTTNEFR